MPRERAGGQSIRHRRPTVDKRSQRRRHNEAAKRRPTLKREPEHTTDRPFRRTQLRDIRRAQHPGVNESGADLQAKRKKQGQTTAKKEAGERAKQPGHAGTAKQAGEREARVAHGGVAAVPPTAAAG